MTNLEENTAWLKDRISHYHASHTWPYALELAIGELYKIVSEIKGSDFDSKKFVDWLSEEYKDPIKLKQWEKDLISVFDTSYSKQSEFWSFLSLKELKRKGYFKGITDTGMRIGEILDNCEVSE